MSALEGGGGRHGASSSLYIYIYISLKNSAPGYDDIPTSVMKKCINDYIAPLTYLVNMSIKQGIFQMN